MAGQPGDKAGGGPNIIANLEDQSPDNESSAALLLPPYQARNGLSTPQRLPGTVNPADEIMEQPAASTRQTVERGRQMVLPPKMPVRGHSKEKKANR